MKRKREWRRVLATMLAVSMLAQNCTTILAGEAETEILLQQEAQMAEKPLETVETEAVEVPEQTEMTEMPGQTETAEEPEQTEAVEVPEETETVEVPEETEAVEETEQTETPETSSEVPEETEAAFIEVAMTVGAESWITGTEGDTHSWGILNQDVIEIIEETGALVKIRAKAEGDVYVAHTYGTGDEQRMETFHIIVAAAETEKESDAETEVQEATLQTKVVQRVVQKKDEKGKAAAYVNYEITVANLSADVTAEDVSVQVLLSQNLSQTAGEKDTAGMTLVSAQETALQIPAGYEAAQAVCWSGRILAPQETKTYRFTAKVAENVKKAEELQNAWYVNGKAIDASCVVWKDAEKLVIKEDPKTVFTYEDTRVKITAVAQPEANLPQNAQLKAKYLSEGSGAYNDAVRRIVEQADDDLLFLDFICYDVYFEADGAEIEPEEGKVRVTMQYKKPVLRENVEFAGEYNTYHINEENGQVEDVTGTVRTNGDGEVTAMTFSTESFSIIAGTTSVKVERGREFRYNYFSCQGRLLGTSGGVTREYFVTINGEKHLAFCIEPPVKGPGDGTYNKVQIIDLNNDVISKIAYYVTHPNEGFFAQDKYKGTSEGARFILGHMAAGYAYNPNQNWGSGAYEFAKNIALELYNYAKNEPEQYFRSGGKKLNRDQLTTSFYQNTDGSWRQKTGTITFKADAIQETTITVPQGITMHVGSTSYNGTAAGKKVTIKGGTNFYFSAPVSYNGAVYTSPELTSYSLNGCTSYKVDFSDSTTKRLQVLALVYGTVTKETSKSSFSVAWNGGGSVSFGKVNEAGVNLSGGSYQVVDQNGKIAKDIAGNDLKWTRTNGTWTTTAPLKAGTYTLTETNPPAGYTVAELVVFTVADNGNVSFVSGAAGSVSGTTVTLTDRQTEVAITKKALNGATELTGARFQILNNGKVEKEWVSDGSAERITGLTAGIEYTLREAGAPAGYTTTEDMTFTIANNGTVTATPASVMEDGVLTVRDALTELSFAKTDRDGKYVAGAVLEIRSKNQDGTQGDIVTVAEGGIAAYDGKKELSWESKDEPVTITGLAAGEYYLVEASAPEGYVKEDAAVSFTVSETISENTQVVTLANQKTKVEITKTFDPEYTLKEDETVVFEIYKDASGSRKELIRTVTLTKDNMSAVVEGLAAGEYILHESAAPAGFTRAADQSFTVFNEMNNGSIVVTGAAVTNRAGELKIRKLGVGENGATAELAGAQLQIVPVDADGKAAEEPARTVYGEELKWVSDGSEKVIRGLAAGTYALMETEAPAGYTVAADILFTVVETGDGNLFVQGTSDNTVTMSDTVKEISFAKLDKNGKYVAGAQLEIHEAQADGTVGEMVVLDGRELKWTTGNSDYTVKGMAPGEYYLVEAEAPEGYAKAAPVQFTADQSRETTAVVMEDLLTRVEVTKVFRDADGKSYGLQPGDEVVFEISRKEPDGEVPIVNNGIISYEKPVNTIEGLPVGEYILREVSAPAGFTLANAIEFEVTDEMDGDDVKAVALAIENEATQVNISKVDIADAEHELAGATLQVLYASGEKEGQVAETVYGETLEWVSSDEVKVVRGLPAGDYILREISAPNGFTVAEDVAFTVTENQQIEAAEVVMRNEAIEVSLSKTDIADAEHELAGATLQVLYASGEKEGQVAATIYGETLEWVSSDEVKVVKGLPAGDYILREISAPAGFTVAEDVPFTIEENLKVAEKSVEVQMQDASTEVVISKVSIAGGEELPGAVLRVLYASGEQAGEVAATVYGETLEWTSGEEAKTIRGLAAGDYILHEETAPTGYGYASDIPFTVTDELKVENRVEMVDEALHFHVNKVDLADNAKEVAGAVLSVYGQDEEGNFTVLIDEWTSVEGETHDFGGSLEAGKEYLLRETTAPVGYKYTADLPFSVGVDGSITTEAKTVTDETGNTVYLVEDGAVTATFTKVDRETGEPLSGAVLRVIDADGNSVEEWMTDGTPHVITAKLAVGATYTLIEVTAPQYYDVAQPITFTVGEDGSVDPVVMEDARTFGAGAVIAVTKTLMYAGDPVNAVDQTFYVALYSDSERTVRVSDVKPLEFRNAVSATAEFNNLELGKRYYIGEADANGTMITSGILADGTLYAANFNEGYEAVVETADGRTEVAFENEFFTIPSDFYREGELTISKTLLDVEGKEKNSDLVFYAGIFADENHTVLSDRVPENIIALDLNGKSSVSTTIPVSLTPGETLSLYITEVTADGTPVEESEDFFYEVTVDGSEITLDENNSAAVVSITNQEEEVDIPQGYYNEGELTVTKRLVGKDGHEKASNGVFYAGIFTDAAHTQLSDAVSANIIRLPLNGNSSVSRTVGVSIAPGEEITLYVTEVDENGVPVENSASFKYEMSVDQTVITMSDTANEAYVTITNCESDGNSVKKAAKTGDETPVMNYVLLLAVSALMLLLLLAVRKRRVIR